jgi:hypothetical protein
MRKFINSSDEASLNVGRVATSITKISVALLTGFLFILITGLNFYLIHTEAWNNAFLMGAAGNYWASFGMSLFACLLGMAGFIGAFNVRHANGTLKDIDNLYPDLAKKVDSRFDKIFRDTIKDYRRNNFIMAILCIPGGLVMSGIILNSSLEVIPLAVEKLNLRWYTDGMGQWVESSYNPANNLKYRSIAITFGAVFTGVAQGFLSPKLLGDEQFIDAAERRMQKIKRLEGIEDWSLTNAFVSTEKEPPKKDKGGDDPKSEPPNRDSFKSLFALGKILEKNMGVIANEFSDFIHKRVGINPATTNEQIYPGITDEEVQLHIKDSSKGYDVLTAVTEFEKQLGGELGEENQGHRTLQLKKFVSALENSEQDLDSAKQALSTVIEKLKKADDSYYSETDSQKRSAIEDERISLRGEREKLDNKIADLEKKKEELENKVATTKLAIKDFLESVNYTGKVVA